MNELKQATREELRKSRYKCFLCKKRGYFPDGTGWRYCFKHWRQNYKWGRCHGLFQAIKDLIK